MNGVDYTKRLAKEREYYNDSIRKNKEATEKQIAHNDERNKYVQQKQLDNFIEDRSEIENHHRDNMNRLKEKVRESVDDAHTKHHAELEKEKHKFITETNEQRKDFNQRLDDIRTNYNRNAKAERELNNDLKALDQKKYRSSIDKMSKEKEETLGKYRERLDNSISELRDEYQDDLRGINAANEERSVATVRDNTVKRSELKDRLDHENKKTKEIHEQELATKEQYFDDKIEDIQAKYKDQFDGMSVAYDAANQKVTKAQKDEILKASRLADERFRGAEQAYNKELRLKDIEMKRRNSASGEFGDVMEKQQGMSDKVLQEKKLSILRDKLKDNQIVFEKKFREEKEGSDETLRTQNAEAAALLERKLNEANANKINTVANEREKNLKKLETRDQVNRNDRKAFEQAIVLERDSAKQRLTKLNENFVSSLKSLEEKHQLSLEDVTKTSNEDKAAFIKMVNENRSKEIFAMKREFSKMMDATVNDYEQRLANYQRDNEYLKMTMDQKVENISDQSSKQMASMTRQFEERRAADIKGQQLMTDQRESQFRQSMNQVTTNFQKKIDKMQVENDTKLKLLTNDYENKLKELRESTTREVGKKDMNHSIEQQRVKQAFDDEKARIISSYENQIAAIKAGYEDQIFQLKDYNRLS